MFTRFEGITDKQYETSGRNNSGVTADALLYLGPRKSLMQGARDPDIMMDLDYRAEMDRRNRLRTGQPLAPLNVGSNMPQPVFED